MRMRIRMTTTICKCYNYGLRTVHATTCAGESWKHGGQNSITKEDFVRTLKTSIYL